MNDETQDVSFEGELASLERSVDELERGELTLEEAIARFENGFRSMRRCYALLGDAQKRIEVLCAAQEGDSEIEWKPFPIKDFELRAENGGEESGDAAVDAAEDD